MIPAVLAGPAAAAAAAAEPAATQAAPAAPPPEGARSAGCGSPPPEAPPPVLRVGEEVRRLIIDIPADYDPATPHRLILAYHGRTTPPVRVRRYYGLTEALAEPEARPTIVAYPHALRQADDTYIWRLPEDLAFFDAIVETLSTAYCVDRSALYAVGHSLGASFANTLACARGATLRATASVAGGYVPTDCTGPTAALLLHNREDRLVPVEIGRRARDALLALNDLPPLPAAQYREPFRCWRYGQEDVRNPVGWCLHDSYRSHSGRFYPHTWPDAAGRVMIRFFDALEREDAAAGSRP